MQGRRVYPFVPGTIPEMEPGDYCYLDAAWGWFVTSPNGCFAQLNFEHTITEHEDATITVSPSILIHPNADLGYAGWHGYLEHGVWREV